MNAVISELITYVIKFVCMILCAAGGICVGNGLKKKKVKKLAEESGQQ
jgi:hypothetical protein